jgi:hypothetical protein
MNEATDPGPRLDNEAPALTPRRGPDLLTLVAGVGSLGIAATALIVGLLLVIGSLRPQHH